MKKILLLSPFPEPHGGIASLTQMMKINGISNDFNSFFIDTKRFNSSQLYRTLKIVFHLIQKLNYLNPDVVQINSSLGTAGVVRELLCATIIKQFGKPLVTHYHGNIPDFHSRIDNPFSFGAWIQLAKLSDVNLMSNKFSLTFFKKCFKSSEVNTTAKLMPNFISDEIFRYKASTCASNRFRVSVVGTISKAKGSDLFVDIARKMPELDFAMLGKIRADMKEHLTCTPPNFKIVNASTQASVYRFLSDSNLFLFLSKSEGFPVSVVEALSIGLPVIATPVGSLPEMIDEQKGGYLVSRKNVPGIIEKICLLSRDVELCKNYGAYNREKSRKLYSFKNVMARLTSIYDDLTELDNSKDFGGH